jgi:hypothetical protein
MKKDRTIIFIAFFAVTSFFSWAFLFFGIPFTSFSFGLLPQYQLWVTAEEKKITLVSDKGAYEDRYSFLKNSEAERQKLKSFIIEDESDQYNLLEETELLGKRFNASTTVTSITQKAVTESKGVKKVSSKTTAPTQSSLEVQLTSKGSFVNVARFMKGLETMPHLIRINKIQLQRLTDAKEKINTVWQASIVIEIFGIQKTSQ